MCNLYNVTTNVDAMRQLFKVTGLAPNLPEFADIYPDREAPIIRADATGERRIELARWGVPPPGNVTRPVTNVRNLASPFWRASLATPARRCLVPVTAFSEWTAEPDPSTGRKRKVWFARPDSEMFAFAGVTRAMPIGEPDRYAFLTCAPNALVGAVHPKAMPVVFDGESADAWLAGAPAEPMAVAVDESWLVIVDR